MNAKSGPIEESRRTTDNARVGSLGTVVCLGVHIVDIHGLRTHSALRGQRRPLGDQIRLTAAGTAAGPSVDLAKLGAQVINMGAIGDDLLGDMLTSLLAGNGVDASRLARKRDKFTSATVISIDPSLPDDHRHVMHMPGANQFLDAGDVDLDLIGAADVLHVGAPERLGDFGSKPLEEVLKFAREHDVVTTMDVLAVRSADVWDQLSQLFPYVNYFMPNDQQLIALTGIDDLTRAAQAVLECGPDAVLVSRAAEGSSLITPGRRIDIPAFPVDVVDVTGCGDSVDAGFIVGLLCGWPIEDAAWLAMATASLVAGGLGSDAGITDLASVFAILKGGAPASVLARLP